MKRVLVTIRTAGLNDEHCDEWCPLLTVVRHGVASAEYYCQFGDDDDNDVASLDFDQDEFRPKRSEFCKREAR